MADIETPTPDARELALTRHLIQQWTTHGFAGIEDPTHNQLTDEELQRIAAVLVHDVLPIIDEYDPLTSAIHLLAEVHRERRRRHAQRGIQDLPDGTGLPSDLAAALAARTDCELAIASGMLSWRHLLEEEMLSALAQQDPDQIRMELIQVAGVAVQWAEAIDRRGGQR